MNATATGLTLGTSLERVEAGMFTVTRSAYTPGQFLRAHTHDLACATIVLRGGVTERVDGRRFECTRDRFLVRPASVVHENRYGATGAECVLVAVRPEWLARDHVMRDVFRAPAIAPAPAPLMIARRIRRERRMGDRAATLAIEGLALELIAVAARQLDARDRRVPPPWLRAVRARLHDDFASDVRLDAIAREASVHPVHLARAFRQCYGCSPGEYVRQRRIDHACTELADSARSIAEIAMNAGFASPSHFATAFRRATGVTPTEYRLIGTRLVIPSAARNPHRPDRAAGLLDRESEDSSLRSE